MRSIMRRTSCAASCAAFRATSCDIARNVTHSVARNIKPQHHAREKLTGEIVKHDAELAHQNLRLSRGTDVFTIRWEGGRGVSVYLTFFYASGPPVVKLDAILFGVSCWDNFSIFPLLPNPLLGSFSGFALLRSLPPFPPLPT